MESDVGKVFIGGISWETTEEKLISYFRTFGNVVEGLIMKDRATGRARGFGFVVFADPSIADRVVQERHMIDGRMVEAKKAVPREVQQSLLRVTHGGLTPLNLTRTKKIFVGGLAASATANDLRNYFEQFGEIADVVVMYDHGTQRPRGFGFITYTSEDSVDIALQNSFHELNGKMVEVKRAIPKELSPGPSRINGGGTSPGISRANPYAGGYGPGFKSPSHPFGCQTDGRCSLSPMGSFSPYGGAGYVGSENINANWCLGCDISSSIGSRSFSGNGMKGSLSIHKKYGGSQVGYNSSNVFDGYESIAPGRNLWSINAGEYIGAGGNTFKTGVEASKCGEEVRLKTSVPSQNLRNVFSSIGLSSYASTDNGNGSSNGDHGHVYGTTISSKYGSSLGRYGMVGDSLFSGGGIFGDGSAGLYSSRSPEYDAFGYNLLGDESLFLFEDHRGRNAATRPADGDYQRSFLCDFLAAQMQPLGGCRKAMGAAGRDDEDELCNYMPGKSAVLG